MLSLFLRRNVKKMRLLNVHVYLDSKDNTIKIWFDALYDEELEKPIFTSPLNFAPRAGELESYFCAYKTDLTNTFNSFYKSNNESLMKPEKVLSRVRYIVEEETHVNIALESNQGIKRSLNLKKSKTNYEKYTAIYTLSTTSYEAVYFILCCANRVLKEYPAIFFGLPLCEDTLSFVDSNTNENFKNDFIITLLKKLYELPKVPKKYQHTLSALHSLSLHYKDQDFKNNQVLFLMTHWVHVENRCVWLLEPMNKLLIGISEDNNTKLSVLLSYARQCIHDSQKEELHHIIYSMNSLAKKQLYKRAMNNKAEQSKSFSWHYPEWFFLRDAEFVIRKDGRIAIVNIQNNSGYLEFYKDRQREPGYTKDIEELVKKLGFELSPCALKNEIIFTEVSTKSLMELGLHWSITYLKKALHMINKATFFAKIQNTPSTQIPKELVKSIIQYGLFNDPYNHLTVDDLEKMSPGCMSPNNSC